MVHLLIDSTHLKRDPSFTRFDTSRVKPLGSKGHLTLHIPYMVHGECMTEAVQLINKDVQQSSKNIASVGGRGLHTSSNALIDQCKAILSEIEGAVVESVKENWREFIAESRAKTYKLNMEASNDVFNAYFSGKPPFPELKSRKDIPDAFIYYEAVRIASSTKKEGGLIVLTADKNFKKHLSEVDGITVYAEYKEVYADERFKKAWSKLEANNSSEAERVKLVRMLPELRDDLQKALLSAHGQDVRLTEGGHGHDAEIESFEQVEVSFIEEEVESFGDGFKVKMKIQGRGLISIYTHPDDFIEFFSDGKMGYSSGNEIVVEIEREFVAAKVLMISLDEIRATEKLTLPDLRLESAYAIPKKGENGKGE